MSFAAAAATDAQSSALTGSASRKECTEEQWEQKVEDVVVAKARLDALVMNYLIIEGYQSAASKFAQEANLSSSVALDSIDERIKIRAAIHAGRIQEAIERINDLNPELLDTNPELHFALLRLQLIELIRQSASTPDGDITAVLNFATTHLASRAQRNPEFLADLEQTMALICFSPDNLVPQLAELMDPELRRQVSIKVNEAILAAQGVMQEAKIRGLVRVWGWAENAVRQEKGEVLSLDLKNLA
ncbi:CTLH/CRA C-terminal to lish motif domain-containing protein [Myxozyma melibiosi]|uniref:CTLH/CRA C-terminal to lish motif domain-containing protein n=1 Tax=Myxozyma melibiosi TaxID=54550 RepID=A0ABR1F7X2_9ASCO